MSVFHLAALAALAERPGLGHLVSREARDLAARFLAEKPRLRFWLNLIPRQGFQRWFERLEAMTLPGIALHQALRKLALEEAVVHGLEAGIEQIVILGGGLDSLGARLARRYPQASFLEIDKAATLSAKRKVLQQSGFLARNLKLIPMEHRADFGSTLRGLPGFRPGEPAFFVCEGVLMHLDRSAVDGLLADLAALPCPALRIAFTFMEPNAKGAIAFRGASRLLPFWSGWRGERFSWGLPARDLGAFLAQRGFALEEIADAGVFRSRFLEGSPGVALAEGEKVAIATVVRN
jgi:methyltransferase (TIGR00027 family)